MLNSGLLSDNLLDIYKMHLWRLILTATLGIAISACPSLTQDIHSSYPSRTTILAQSNITHSNASVVNHIRKHTQDRIVLAYVTPWNPRGIHIAEAYRGKFDIISPAWHTADVIHTGGKTYYQIGGSPSGDVEVDWMRRMQKPAKDGNGRELPTVNISPRYVLDRFTPEELVELLTSDENMASMTRTIVESVEEHDYDGIIFECAAVWAIEKLLAMLAEELHNRGKTIVTVIPALRQDKDPSNVQATSITLHATSILAPLVDYLMIMTYDHAGPTGRPYKEVYDVDALPTDSPLRQEGVRAPGPNTPLDYLTINAEQLSAELEGVQSNIFFPMQGQQSKSFSISSKMLMGLPFYGYSYSIGWFDQTSSSTHGVVRIPPSSPIASKDNDTDAQAASRQKAQRKEDETPTVIPVLRFPGEPFKQDDLIGILEDSKALVRLDESSHEQYIDYVAKLPPSRQPNLTEEEKLQSNNQAQASYYRTYFPSAHTIKSRLQAMDDFPQMGVAIWELAFGGNWLLDEL